MFLQTNNKLVISHGIHCHQFTWDAYEKCHVEDVAEFISDHEEAENERYNHSFVVFRSPDTYVATICFRFSGVIPNLYFQTFLYFRNFQISKHNLQHIMSIKSMVQVLRTDVF
jgi:hypothetical protein